MTNDASILTLHLIRCEKTIAAALDKVEPSDFNIWAHEDVIPYGVLWDISREYYKKYSKPIPRTQLESKFNAMCSEYGGSFDIGAQEEALGCIEWMFDVEEVDLNHEEALTDIGKMLYKTRVKAPVSELMNAGEDNLEDLQSVVERGMSQAEINPMDTINPMDFMESFAGSQPAQPVGGAGCIYFNELCQGGLRPGEVATLIGPTGGFKTTMALDIAGAMALVGEDVLYLTYEQAWETGDLPSRVFSRVSGVPRATLDSTQFDELSEEDRAKMIKSKKKVASHFIIADRSSHVDRVSDIANLVGDLIARSTKPRLVIIDQLLTWISDWDSMQDEAKRGPIMRDCIRWLKKYVAEKYGVSVLVLHQLTAALAGGSPNRIPNQNDSAECKSLNFWADFGLMLGNADADSGVLWAVAAKTRRGVYTKILLKEQGAVGRLTKAEGYTESASIPGRIISETDDNKIPDVATGATTRTVDSTVATGSIRDGSR